MASLSNVTATFKALVEFGMQQLRVSVIKPRVHPWIDVFLTNPHHFTEVSILSFKIIIINKYKSEFIQYSKFIMVNNF